MTFERRRAWAAGLLLALALLGGTWLLRLDYARKISTDVLDLIPADERSPELTLVRTMASEREARTMLFVLTNAEGGPAPVEAAKRFAAELGGAPVFAQAIALGDPSWRDAMGRALFELRFPLLFPSWLGEELRAREAGLGQSMDEEAQDAAKKLQAFLASPEGLAYQDMVTADPLLLVPAAVRRLSEGLLALDGGAGTLGSSGLVWAQLAVSPLEEAGQGAAFAAIARALEAVRADHAGVRAAYTGVNRFAAASRARIEREVSWLNGLALAAVLAVAAIFIRRVHRALHLVPVIGCAVLGAWVGTTLVFERVHVIVFVLGALLVGVAIDYGFYIYMQPPATGGEDYASKVRRLAKPLVASCLTTVAGFALLLVSELPMIRQLGVFVGVGLLCALGAAVLYFATVREPFLPAREFRRARSRGRVAGALGRTALAIAGVVALLGLGRVTWRDDLRELELPAPELKAEDARIRAAFGQTPDRTVYLTHGVAFAQAREAAERLEAWLRARGASFGSLAPVLPRPGDFRRAVEFARTDMTFYKTLLDALEAEGFAAEEFVPFVKAYGELARLGTDDYERVVRGLHGRLAGPLSLLLHAGEGRSWIVTVAKNAPAETPPPDAHTVAVSQLQSLNRLFAGYRQNALQLSLAGLGLVGVGVLLTYGVRDGARIFAIPCGTCLAVFGVFGWLGQPLNLFHLLGAFLGVCLTHNYSIFTATSVYRGEAMPVSVRLSALTTGASFGVLAFSGIPVVRALGLTVAAMVVAALAVIELEALGGLRGGASRRSRGGLREECE